jgi:hypothetical protein
VRELEPHWRPITHPPEHETPIWVCARFRGSEDVVLGCYRGKDVGYWTIGDGMRLEATAWAEIDYPDPDSIRVLHEEARDA